MLSIFDNDEQIYINSVTKNMTMSQIKDRARIVHLIGLVLQSVSDEMKEFTAGVYKKILQMTESEWATIAAALPFQLMYGEDDIDMPPYNETG